jgi:hypothetical protein
MLKRRTILAGAAAATAAAAVPDQPAERHYLELHFFRLRNGSQMRRTNEFLSQAYLPMCRRAGIGPVGVFSNVIGPDSPSILMVTGYPSLAHIEGARRKMEEDAEYRKAAPEFKDARAADPAYVRREMWLLRGIQSVPRLDPPPTEDKRPSRLFELRIYESHSLRASREKIAMFDQAETAIFRRCGLRPVFFGEALYGPRLPNLTYMVAYDDMAAREKAWAAFREDPEWKKISQRPGWTDAEIVTNISNSLLRPTPYSPIR